MKRAAAILALALLAAPAGAPAGAFEPVETPSLKARVAAGALPPVAERMPAEPLIVDLEAKGRTIGRHGGTWHTLIAKPKNIKYMAVWGYARLVGYDHRYELKPDLLRDIEVRDGRIFTLHLREGHRWSDGHPFTTEDFRYWWEDVANNDTLQPGGPPISMMPEGHRPVVTIVDELTIRYTWPVPHPTFMASLAAASPPFIYRPAHYMKKFHIDYAEPGALDEEIAAAKVRGWAPLHNKRDNMYKNDNPELPTLQPWATGKSPTSRHFISVRNPYFHRFDMKGQQLPYFDTVDMTVAASGLIPAKTNAGENSLQAYGLSFANVAILKRGEREHGYRTLLWANGAASQIALYPNLNYSDEGWREVLRDARFRRALSLAIDRRMINRALYFGLAHEAAVAPLPESPLYDAANARAYASLDLAQANALLDQMGLGKRRGDGIRLLPDGRPAEVILETAGERPEVEDALQLVTETWRDIGIKLTMRPLARDILRNRVYAGLSMMAVWYGWDNGVPSVETSPDFLAPRFQENFSWPKWGQYFQTRGEQGQPPDMDKARTLMHLSYEWEHARSRGQRRRIWNQMLDIHAEQVFAIGLISGAPQPVVVRDDVRNVPERGLYAWDPGAHLGIHRPDEFYFASESVPRS